MERPGPGPCTPGVWSSLQLRRGQGGGWGGGGLSGAGGGAFQCSELQWVGTWVAHRCGAGRGSECRCELRCPLHEGGFGVLRERVGRDGSCGKRSRQHLSLCYSPREIPPQVTSLGTPARLQLGLAGAGAASDGGPSPAPHLPLPFSGRGNMQFQAAASRGANPHSRSVLVPVSVIQTPAWLPWWPSLTKGTQALQVCGPAAVSQLHLGAVRLRVQEEGRDMPLQLPLKRWAGRCRGSF